MRVHLGSPAGLAASLFLLIAVVASPSPAMADGLLVDGSTVTAEEADDGSFTAEVNLLNTGPDNVDLESVVDLNAACAVELDTTRLPAFQSTPVKLTIEQSCFDDTKRVKVDLDGRGQLPVVTVKKPAKETHDWSPLEQAAGVALFVALLVFGIGAKTRHDVDEKQLSPSEDELEARGMSYEAVKDLVDTRMTELSAPPLNWVAVPAPSRFEWGSEVKGLDAGWSFQDSWVSNLTVAATGFVALATSIDAFTALLGEEPKASLRVMVVAGLISAALIALANTVVKLFGSSTSTVSVAGLVVSTSLVVFAAILQTMTVGLAANSLVTGLAGLIAIGLMVAVSVAVLGYSVRALHEALAKGPADSLPSVPVEALEGWKATELWEKKFVEQGIRTAFKEWLEDDPQGLMLDTVAITPQWMATSPGDSIQYPRRRASLP